MGRTCRGICEMHRAEAAPNKIRYEIGQKKMYVLWNIFGD